MACGAGEGLSLPGRPGIVIEPLSGYRIILNRKLVRCYRRLLTESVREGCNCLANASSRSDSARRHPLGWPAADSLASCRSRYVFVRIAAFLHPCVDKSVVALTS